MDSCRRCAEKRLAVLERHIAPNKEETRNQAGQAPDFCSNSHLFHSLYANDDDGGVVTNVVRVKGGEAPQTTTFVRDELLPYLHAQKVYMFSLTEKSPHRAYRENTWNKYDVIVLRDWSRTVSAWLHDNDMGSPSLIRRVHVVVDAVATDDGAHLLLERLIKDTITANLPITWILLSTEASFELATHVVGEKYVSTVWFGPSTVGTITIPEGCVGVQLSCESRLRQYSIHAKKGFLLS